MSMGWMRIPAIAGNGKRQVPVVIIGFLPPDWAVVVSTDDKIRRAHLSTLRIADDFDVRGAMSSARLKIKRERTEARFVRMSEQRVVA